MRILHILFILLISSHTYTQNILSGNGFSVNEKTSFEYAISLNNNSNISALQFDIEINQEAFTYGTNHILTNRASGLSISTSNPSTNVMRVVMYSSSNNVIGVGSGAIAKLNITSKTLPGDYSFSISNVVLSDATGNALSNTITNGAVSVRGAHLNVNTTNIAFGRVPMGANTQRSISISNNGNENLIISSVAITSPFSLSTSLPITISPGANQSISILLDASQKYDSSLDISYTTNDNNGLRQLQKTTVSANVYAVNEIHVGSGSGEIHSEISIPVSFNNMEPFSGFQFDVTLPQNITYVNNSVVLSSRKDDHVVSGNMIDTNTLRIISYSNSNAEFSGVEGVVMSFKLKPKVSSGNYNLTISNPIISNISLGNIESGSYSGSIQINSPNLVTSTNSISFGRVPITETKEETIRLTNNGSAELVINSIVKDVSLFNIDTATPFSIAQGKSKDIKLTFSPNSIGTVNQNISIRHNGSAQQNVINVTADVFSPNYLKVKNITVEPGSSSFLDIELYNNNDIRGIQFDVTLNPEFDYNVSNYSLINNGFIFSSSNSNLGSNTYRFILYNISGETITKGSGSFLRIPFNIPQNTNFGDYTVSFTNVFISGSNNTNVSSEALNIGYINVNDNTPPVITLLGEATVDIEVGSTYTDAGATASDNYDGDITDDIVTVNNVDTSTIGTYSVTYNVSDANNNAAVQVTRTVNVVSSLSVDEITKLNLKVYPNPTQDYWKLTAKEIINSIELYDSIGRKVLYLTPKSETLEINASTFDNGVYILIINNKKTIRLIKH